MTINNKSNLGDVHPGDVILLSRLVYGTDPAPLNSTGAAVTITIMDEYGNAVAEAPASVVTMTPTNKVGMGVTSYDTSFQVTIPDGLIGTPEGRAYTAIMAFTLNTPTGVQTLPVVQESFKVIDLVEGMLGPQPAVVTLPYEAELNYFFTETPTIPDRAGMELRIFYGNNAISTLTNVGVSSSSTWVGRNLKLTIDTSALRPSLMPYAAIWAKDRVQEIAPLFVINPSICLAMRELHDFVNKNCSDWSTRELTFIPEQLIAALYNGACMFNSEGIASDFTMLDARGSIRNFWLQYSTVWLLKSQVLNGIETDFNYTNSSITLDVDRASKYQSFADSLESQLTNAVRPLKIAMSKRGNMNGDGSLGPLSLRPGAIGAVGLSLSPVSKVGTMFNPYSWRAALLNPGMDLGSMT